MTGVMPNDPCPMAVGDEGTVEMIGAEIQGRTQIYVKWDNGRSLILLDSDPFVVVPAGDPWSGLKGHPYNGECLQVAE
jgi:hypothetical protein